MRKYILLTSLLVLLAFAHCGKNHEEIQDEKRIVVKTTKVEQKEISVPIHTSGKLYSQAEMKLSFKVGGFVKEIFVDEGQVVKKGQILARLDLSEIEARVIQARSAYKKAERDFQRVERLYSDSVATLEQSQDASTAYDIANSNLQIAEFNLKYSSINAPTDGKILHRFVEANELVDTGIPIFYFGSSGQDWIVRVGVTDKDVIRLQLDDPAFIFFDAYPGIKFSAQVSEIAQTADPRSGTYEVELKVNQGDYKLISGFVAKVDIIPSKKQKFSFIPIEALVEGDKNQGFVYALEPSSQRAKKIPVTIGPVSGTDVGVLSSLVDIEEVITDGAPYLADGSIVEVVGH